MNNIVQNEHEKTVYLFVGVVVFRHDPDDAQSVHHWWDRFYDHLEPDAVRNVLEMTLHGGQKPKRQILKVNNLGE